MYCKYCGQQIADDAVVCVNCGRAVKEEVKQVLGDERRGPLTTGQYILSIIATIILPIIGYVIAFIGFTQNPVPQRKNQSYVILGVAIVMTVINAAVINGSF